MPGDKGFRSAVYQELHKSHAGKLAGKVVGITGASRGLGAAMAVGAAGAGADVVLLSRTMPDMAEIATICGDAGPGRHLCIETDVTSPESVIAAVDRIDDEYGRLDGWINNAGVCMELWRDDHVANPIHFDELTIEGWRHMVEVNLNGAFICVHTVVPFLLRSGFGSLINILTGRIGFEKVGYTPYGVTKGGLWNLTASLSKEFEGKLRFNALVPGGPTHSAMLNPDVFPEGAPVMQSTVIVPPAVFLLSEESRDVTGQFVVSKEWDAEHGFPVEVQRHERVPA